MFPNVISFTLVNEDLRFFSGWQECAQLTVGCGIRGSITELSRFHGRTTHVQQLQIGIEARMLAECTQNTKSGTPFNQPKRLPARPNAIIWLRISPSAIKTYRFCPNLTDLVLVEVFVHPLSTLIDFLSHRNEKDRRCTLTMRGCSYLSSDDPDYGEPKKIVVKRLPDVNQAPWNDVFPIIQRIEETSQCLQVGAIRHHLLPSFVSRSVIEL